MREVCGRNHAPISFYGLKDDAAWQAAAIHPASGGMNFTVLKEGTPWGEFFLPMVGEHNVLNALAALAVLSEVGAEPRALKEVLPGFQGVKKRQEVAGEFDGILVLEDFAHHPTAVGVTLAAVRQAYPTRRLVAAFEPRTNTSRRKIFQEPYAAAFKDADLILVREPPDLWKVEPEEGQGPGQHRLSLGILPADDVTHHHQVGDRRQVFGAVTVLDGNSQALEQSAHGRVDVFVGAGDVVAQLFQNAGQSGHAGAADAEEVDMHESFQFPVFSF